MDARIQLITHQGKQVLLVDFSNCSAAEVKRICQEVPDLVTTLPFSSALILSDFTRASFDKDAIQAMKETAVFDKPHVKKSAWVGAEYFPLEYSKSVSYFSRREFPTFKSREDALEWLVRD